MPSYIHHVTAVLLVGMISAMAYAEPPRIRVRSGEITVAPDPGFGPVGARVAELFARQARSRSGIEVTVGTRTSAKPTVLLRKSETQEAASQPASHLGEKDSFHLVIRTTQPRVELSSPTPSGLMAGMGHLMRLCGYGKGELELPVVDVQENAAMPVRGIYFATHFGNFYDAAPLEKIDPVIEDLALWGTNQLVVWFDMHHYKSFEDPRAQAHLARLRRLAITARSLGMKFGLVFLGNEAYADSPPDLRAKYKLPWPHYHVELCPATSQGMALIAREQERVLRAFDRVDVCWVWPYDQGGCACEKCMPWGGNGFLRVARQLGELYRTIHPGGQFWVSTWLFDAHDENGKLSGEKLIGTGDYEGFLKCLKEDKPDWMTGIIMGTQGSWLPKPLLSRPQPERYPLTAFPEISMRLMDPWGATGANPMPDYCEQLAAGLRGQIVGGWPYSEGIYEDFNKFYFARFFWNSAQTASDAAHQYAAYYFGSDGADQGARLLALLEKTHPRQGWKVSNLSEADEAFSICQDMERQMPSWASGSWRWRIVRLRAEIDYTLRHDGLKSDEGRAKLASCADELRRIYHAERAEAWVRPLRP